MNSRTVNGTPAQARRFAGQVALVTGASRGIGLGIARRLVAEGARVCLTGRDAASLDEAVTGLGGPTHALGIAGRSDDAAHRAAAVAATVETFGRLDVLVNNAGTNPVHGPLLDADPASVRKTFEVNVFAVLGWVQEAHRAWLGEHGGRIVCVSSVSGLGPAPAIGVYGASKAALIRLTEQLAVELAPRIRVNALAPAVVKTRFAAALYEGRESQVAAGYPLGRLGVPADVADAAAFLASEESSWITGQTLVVDGGVTLH
ncbi:3-oxoacyl-[acyl-carrier protein] reductase [Actinoalloteichus hoggarensis]|uniref:3-oxoacyl-[acyl-carrier-protein] reductase FabG n=1 Tax=Actinoalloteichus hoggarensis TaxID=1470176 RepID=A0A221W380_9PSEU|nr:SDR family oxidoreductase [Actinoalloteichus hoggarensis]ASO20184.1 3-oxoacyl-[acyl-carrier-protein] reductase FabG [Actinoalloteichus hoggarensis]MBB5919103.1 3-oxoacyl-[acyl-carrier protein] reductase [Actinoalloteichus hoggarensis]